jgi:hypothetical protein
MGSVITVITQAIPNGVIASVMRVIEHTRCHSRSKCCGESECDCDWQNESDTTSSDSQT